MGFLLYADLLGFAQLQKDRPTAAKRALKTLQDTAFRCLDLKMPGGKKALDEDAESRVVCFNDSVFFHCRELPLAIHYASTLAYHCFLAAEEVGGPLALRGTIIRTDEIPEISLNQRKAFFAASLLTNNIGAALVAEKQKVLGARIIFQETYLTEAGFPDWDPRLQAKVVQISEVPGYKSSEILRVQAELKDYCDVAWMNVESVTGFPQVRASIDRMLYGAVLHERAALHGAATLAMFRAIERRRHMIGVILAKLRTGAQKAYRVQLVRPKETDYAGWLKLAQRIRRLRGSLEIPYRRGSVKA